MTRHPRTVTYVYESLIPSRENDYGPEDSTFRTDDFVYGTVTSSWQSDKDAEDVYDRLLDTDIDRYPQQSERDRVKDVTNRSDPEKDYDFPTKITPGKENENTIKPTIAKVTETPNHLETDKHTVYTKKPTPETDQEYTTERKLEQETNKLSTRNRESDNVDTYTTKANLVNGEGDTEELSKGNASSQQAETDKNNATTNYKEEESTTSKAQPEMERTSPNSFKHDEENNNESESPQNDKKNNNMKTLLWYDTHEKSMRGHTTTLGFSKCEYSNCQYKSYLSRTDTKPRKPFDADVILIQSAGIWDLSPPPRRDENQVFVLAVRDSFPRTTAERDPGMGMKWVDVFNWTMTYRLDSDIVFKYGNIVERENKSEIANKNYGQIFDEKVDNAVWFVSHCRTNSMREHYVREMQSVMGVDIFGGCTVPAPCPKGSKDIETECIDDTAIKYKYYLSFENTLVEDYVTEKVYRWYGKDIIVVVRGGSNYSRILPPGTFVDAGDFASPVELGKYLKELAHDKKRYTDILKKKDNYYSTDYSVPAQEANCKLCEYLNNIDDHRRSYDNIIKWWLKNWKNFGIKPAPLKGWPRNSG